MDTKMLAPHPASGLHHRGTPHLRIFTLVALITRTGYSAPGVEKVLRDVFDPDEIERRRAQAPDVKESFECGREDDPLMPNIWLPKDMLPGFKEACLDFYWVGFVSLLPAADQLADMRTL